MKAKKKPKILKDLSELGKVISFSKVDETAYDNEKLRMPTPYVDFDGNEMIYYPNSDITVNRNEKSI